MKRGSATTGGPARRGRGGLTPPPASGQWSLHAPGGGPVPPLYRQIERTVAAQIRKGALPVGSVVPSERQICEQFGVSHITARRALLELQRRGLIYRQAGIGTFVAGPQRRTRLTLVFAGFDADRWQSTAGVMGDLVGGITEVAWRRHCGLDIERLDTGLDAGDLSRLLVERETDGLLLRLAGDATPAHIALLEETRVPFVLILTCIRTSHYETGKVAAEAVIELILSPEQHAQQLVIEPVLEVQASCGAASTDRCISSQS